MILNSRNTSISFNSKVFFILIIFVVYSNNILSQVGIFTEDPKASLDISALSTATVPNGLLIPRMTGDDIEAMVVSSDQNGLLVYATSISTATLPIVDMIGFWYYDVVDITWKPLSVERRKSIVIINSDGSGDYKTLQDAYNGEAQKLYKVHIIGGTQREFIEFKCTGSVGPLTANGVIPQMKITADGTTSIDRVFIYNTTIILEGDMTLTDNLTVINSYFKINKNSSGTFKQLSFKKSLADINDGCNLTVSNIDLDQSSLNITGYSTNFTNINFQPDGNIKAGISLLNSGLKTSISCNLSFIGGNTFTDYILCDDASFLNAQCTIKAIAPVSNAVVLSRQNSKATLGIIEGTAVPSKVFHVLTGGKIEHFRGYINMSTSGPAFLAAGGGEISLGGEATTANSTITSTSSTFSGLTADGGSIVINSNIQPYTYTLKNYDYALRVASCGRIITLGKILQDPVNPAKFSNQAPGTFNASGAVIFTGS